MTKEKKETRKGFAEGIQTAPTGPLSSEKLKKGKMSRPFESALNAVENMEKNKKH